MKLMKMQAAADYLGVHKNTLRKWIEVDGRKITHFVDPITRYKYFRQEDLDSFWNAFKASSNGFGKLKIPEELRDKAYVDSLC